MTISARLQITSPAEDLRAWPRHRLRLEASLQSTGENVTIHDFSSTGLLIETAADLGPFDSLEIDLPEAGITHALVVWNSGRYYGCQFKERLPQAAVSAALLRSPSAMPADLAAPPTGQPPTGPATEVPLVESAEIHDPRDEEKASLGVRLRVILGSAILLWALIFWAIRSLIELI